MGQRDSDLAAGYSRFLWFVVVLLAGGEVVALLVAVGLLPVEAFSLMPLASRDLFLLLAVASPFLLLYIGLLASRNFEDLDATSTGVALPIRSLRQMIADDRREIPFADVEGVTFLQQRGVDFVEIRLRAAVGRKPVLLFPSLWIVDETAFAAALANRVAVTQSRPLRGGASSG